MADPKEFNPYAPPTADVGVPRNESQGELPWFAVGTTKLIVMVVLSLGIYTIFWFERHYRFQSRLTGERMWPIARGFFSLFFANDLFGRVQGAAERLSVPVRWSAGSMAGLFIVLLIINRVLDRATADLPPSPEATVAWVVGVGLLGLLAVPLQRVQETANEILKRTHPDFDRNESFTVWNWLVIIIGASVIGLATLGSLAGEP